MTASLPPFSVNHLFLVTILLLDIAIHSYGIPSIRHAQQPAADANLVGPDGYAPADLVARYGSLAVAKTLVAYSEARFYPRHLAEARARGHQELVAWLDGVVIAEEVKRTDYDDEL